MNYETQLTGDIGSFDPDPDGEFARRRRRRQVAVAAMVGALLVLLVSMVMGWQKLHGGPSGTSSQAEVPRVSVITARFSPITNSVTGTGSIAARRDMPVGVVGEGGRVVRVLVEPGQWVGAGQILAVIERSVQAQQAAALAAAVQVARADAKLAEANLARARALVADGFISKADLDSKTALRDAAVARVNVAVAQLNQAQASMARLDVRAPLAGLVLTRNVEPGQIVSSGSGVLFHIAQNGEMEMKLAVNEGDIAKVKVGDMAQVRPIGVLNPVAGTVWQVSPVVDAQSRQGVARILLRRDPTLRPGSFAQATITTGQGQAILLPQSAVQSDTGGNFVYVVDRENRIVRRPVTSGLVSDTGVAITTGLSVGDQVVATAGGFLNPGDAVKPVRLTHSGG
ncbi:MAG TPA: efflux RND transporter periplasmic adaptor subunit [Sphingobium sp.]|nr:efflux RND transporter periplasmic adaptor subunit [Sphingobium sp.]